jgi:5'(3')-deoxyribonucleotidase
VKKISNQSSELKDKFGYDTAMIFVNTSLEKAIERNNARERVLPEKIVVDSWNAAQKARDEYERIFGASFYEIQNDKDTRPGEPVPVDKAVEKRVDAFLRTPVANPVGKEWIKSELEAKRSKVNEADGEYKIYCDMDGVLCDFERQWMKYFNKDANEHRREIGKPAYDVLLDGTPFDFWAKMEWQPGGQKLWNAIKMHNPSILSAPADSKASEDGKKAWVAKNLKPQPEVIFRKSNRKQEFATPNSILIDDHGSNIERWKAAGGIAIHHTNINKTLSELSKYITL